MTENFHHLPLELVRHIIQYQRPTYPYMRELKQKHKNGMYLGECHITLRLWKIFANVVDRCSYYFTQNAGEDECEIMGININSTYEDMMMEACKFFHKKPHITYLMNKGIFDACDFSIYCPQSYTKKRVNEAKKDIMMFVGAGKWKMKYHDRWLRGSRERAFRRVRKVHKFNKNDYKRINFRKL